MGRPLREQEEGALYELVNRTEQQIHLLAPDKQEKVNKIILGLLSKYAWIYGVEIFAFCFMSNHFHILACCKSLQLHLFMRDFQSQLAKKIKPMWGEVVARKRAGQEAQNAMPRPPNYTRLPRQLGPKPRRECRLLGYNTVSGSVFRQWCQTPCEWVPSTVWRRVAGVLGLWGVMPSRAVINFGWAKFFKFIPTEAPT